MEISSFELEKDFAKQGYGYIIGTDEVGRGPLCGPVIACAAMFKDPNFEIPQALQKEFDLIRDSKKLSEKQREKVYAFIEQHFNLGIGLCDHETIDRINILEASFLAMKKAISDLAKGVQINKEDPKLLILVDGNKQIPNLTMRQYAVIGGDRISKSISAASIVAKVTRDRLMEQMHAKFPEYGFDKHKGYGTKLHLEALTAHGPCEIHRKSFGPVKESIMRRDYSK
jgi:ribonuclease HII